MILLSHKDSPVVTTTNRVIYAINQNTIKLACEVKSNPQSIISWQFKGKEIQEKANRYSMKKSLIKQFDHSYLDDAENIHAFVSTLTVTSLTQFDYGQYTCHSNNIIGGNSQFIKLNQKQKPQMPTDLQVII